MAMLEAIKNAYADRHALRRLSYIGLLLGAVLLAWLAGGFPPQAWLFLVQTLPQLALLWRQHGSAILLPIFGLVALSLTLLLLWLGLTVAALKAVQYEWLHFRHHERFRQELTEAEQMGQQMLAEEQVFPIANMAEFADSQTGTHPVTPRTVVDEQPVPAPQATRSAHHTSFFAQQHTPLARQEMVALQEPEPPTRPTITRGSLRLVPRPEEDSEDNWDDIPEIETPVYKEPSGLEVSVGLHTGFQRKDTPNGDALFEIRGTHSTRSGLQHVGLFVIADGMHNNGRDQEASHLAIETISSIVVPTLLSSTRVAFTDLLKEGISAANIALYRQNKTLQERGEGKMGTTITASLIVGPMAYIANVGNSRAYLYRTSAGLQQITRDHTPVGYLQEQGCLNEDEARQHPHRKMLERYLGRQATIEADIFTLPLHNHDMLLLCSDGLWAMTRHGEIAQLLNNAQADSTQVGPLLVQNALNHGGADNISVIVIQYHGDSEEG
jgi:serine/threonine protein phosphatase PrpC